MNVIDTQTCRSNTDTRNLVRPQNKTWHANTSSIKWIIDFVLSWVAHGHTIVACINYIPINTNTSVVRFAVSLVRTTCDRINLTFSYWILEMVTLNTIALPGIGVENLETLPTSLDASVALNVQNLIKQTSRNDFGCFAWLSHRIIHLSIRAENLALAWSCVIKLLRRALVTLRNALSCQVVKYLFAFAFNWTPDFNTNVINPIVPSDRTIAVIFTLVRLFVKTLVVLTFIAKFW